MIDITQLLTRLIDIPSMTGGESALARWLADYFRGQSIATELQHVENDRHNLVVNYNNTTKVIFCTHLDTVPPFKASRIDGNMIYGRGACDAKGIIAAMIDAALSLQRKNENEWALLFVVGEEVDSIGAKKAAKAMHSRFVVVGEPTENKLARGQKGSLSYRLTTSGIAGHSAYPERGRSAIHTLLEVMEDIRKAEWGRSDLLGEATCNIGLIDGGSSANTIADHASAFVFHRLVDSMEKRKTQLISLVNGRAAVDFHAQNDPQQLHVVEGFETTTVNFGSDVPYLRAIGTPMLVGPGSIHSAHTDDEKISIDELKVASELYEKLYFALAKDES